MALTEDGDVWTWGYGGKNYNFITKIFFSGTGALGHGDYKTRSLPKPVEFLRKLPPIEKISCGLNFCVALNK